MVRGRSPAYTPGYPHLICSALAGILVVLFFQCMAALFSSANRRREGIKWWLVSYTVFMLSFATILLGTGMAVQFDCYIDNREYPGVKGKVAPGPLGHKYVIGSGALLMTGALMFQLNYWLADGFLVGWLILLSSLAEMSNTASSLSSIVAMRSSPRTWAVALPCLLYLASVGMYLNSPLTGGDTWTNAVDIATGIMALISQALGRDGLWTAEVVSFRIGIVNTSISIGLNILLTIMIVTRLVLHGRDIHVTAGSSTGLSGLYKSIVTMFIESSARYSGISSVVIALWATEGSVSFAFVPALCIIQVCASRDLDPRADRLKLWRVGQVIAPLLIIERVANRSALTSDHITGRISSLRVKSQGEPTDTSDFPASRDPFRVGDGAEISTIDRYPPA